MDLDLNILTLARGLAAHSAARQSVIAENVANADTPGYRARDVVSFAEVMEGQPPFAMRATRAGHLADSGAAARFGVERESPIGVEAPNGNTVSLEDQMMRSAATKHNHDMALGVFRKSLDILRSSLGRRA